MKSEKDLVEFLSNQFSNMGFIVKISVRILPKEIDIVLLEPYSKILITVEAKLKDLKKALLQAESNSMYSHYSIIATNKKNISEKFINDVKKNNIGLIQIVESNGLYEMKMIVKPNKSLIINNIFKRKIYKKFSLFIRMLHND